MDGRIDSRNRLLLRLELEGEQDSLLAVVDTGFSHQLLLHRAKATEIGVALIATNGRIVVADGRSVVVRQGEVTIIWHGQSKCVSVLIVDAPLDPIGGDAPTDCLVGVELMQDSELLVEFSRKAFWLAQVGVA